MLRSGAHDDASYSAIASIENMVKALAEDLGGLRDGAGHASVYLAVEVPSVVV